MTNEYLIFPPIPQLKMLKKAINTTKDLTLQIKFNLADNELPVINS